MKQTKQRKKLQRTLLLGLMTLAALLLTMTMLGCDPDDDNHSHTFNGTEYDEINHWETCKCGTTQNKKAHVYDDESDTECNVCGFIQSDHTHIWGEEWLSDEDSHWHNCTIPGCTIVFPSKHTLSSGYKTDSSSHWMDCSVCGYKFHFYPHGYNSDSDPKCDACGYVRNVVCTHEHWSLRYKVDQHWLVCRDCSATKDYSDHKFSGKWVLHDGDSHWRNCVCSMRTYSPHVYDNNTDFSCNLCGYLRIISHAHTWSEWIHNDENHWQNCTKCAASRNFSSHKYKWKYSADGHWQECICEKKSETKSHVYDDTSDPSCNTCGYIRKLHDHVWQTDWSKDETHHWHDCTVKDCKDTNDYAVHSYTFKPGINGHFGECICGQKTQTEDHVYDNDWDSTCNLCGYMRYIYIPTPDPIVPPHTHEWTWTNDDDGHWQKCSCGEEKPEEKAEHEYPDSSGNYASNAESHWIECTICGHEKLDSRHAHNPIMNDIIPVWYSDANDHWQECNDCKYKLAVEPHDKDGKDGNCSDCGYNPNLVPTP